MKLQLQAAELKSILRILQLADKAAAVVFSGDTASVIGSKVSLSIKRTELHYEGEQKKFAVSLVKLSEAVSTISGPVTLEVDKALTVRAGRARFKLPLLEASLEPPKFPDGISHLLPLAAIKNMLAFSLAGTGLINGAPFFACDMLRVYNTGKYLRSVGTDGQKLFLAESTLTDDYGSLLIPIHAVRILQELPGKTTRFIETDNALFFESEGVTIAAQKRIKDFPDVDRIWPKKWALEFSVDSEDFLSGLKQVAPMASDAIQLSYDGYTLGFFASNEGEAETEIDAKAIYPEPLFEDLPVQAIKLSYKHLRDFFSAVTGEIFVNINDNTSPLLFTANAGGDERKMLVVPLI